MPFFRGGQSIPPSSHYPRHESFPAPPSMFSENDSVLSSSTANSQTDKEQAPKKELNGSAKRFARKAGKQNGLTKLIRRHSSKLPREVEPVSPLSEQEADRSDINHLSVGSYDGLLTLDKKSNRGVAGSGNKVTFAAKVEQDIIFDYSSSKSKKSGKLPKRSKSISHKMPLTSALKNSSISSASSYNPVHSYSEYDSLATENGWRQRQSRTLGPRSKSVQEDHALTRQQNYNAVFAQDTSRGESVRTVVLARTKKGFGFVLRGAKAEQLRKLNVQFVPSEKMPALQYLDSVEKGSVSDKAGLRAGDFILEIDGVDVVQASHEQTVQVIKKAGDVLAMKVVRAVLTQENGGTSTAANAVMNGSATLPHRKPQKEEAQPGSNSAVLLRKTNGDAVNGIATDEENLALEQLDATLANYDSDSRSSGSGAIPPSSVTFRDQKTASIRQRPSSSHFNSIQELDDMFAAPAPAAPVADKADSRKPAKSRAKKFWSKGKTSTKLSGSSKQLSLSQPNLAALDKDGEVKPITMYEMSLGHSIDAENRVNSDLAMGRRKSIGGMSSGTGSTEPIVVAAPLPPPPPTFPAPAAPEESKKPPTSTSTFSSSGSQNAPSTLLRSSRTDNKQFLPRTPLPADAQCTNSSSPESFMLADGGTLQRSKIPPPPPQRLSSHESGVIIAMQDTSAQSANEKVSAPSFPTLNQSNSFTQQPSTNKEPAISSFSEAIRKAAADREADKSAQHKNSTSHTSVGNELYAVVQKRQARVDAGESNVTTAAKTSRAAPAVSVEDQLKQAVAKRRTVIERRDTATDSDRSHSQTPERSLSPDVKDSKPEATNFRELAELKRQQFLKKKADSRDKMLPPPAAPTSGSNKFSNSSTEENLSELQNVMNRLSVAKADEPNNNIKKKTPPPVATKKTGSKTTSPTTLHDHLSPVEEFPPPPPPHDFGPNSADIIIPPPSFEVASQPAFGIHTLSPPAYCADKNVPAHHHNEADNHSVTSSVGSDTISSVSQDGNRLSVATSGYSSDPNRSTKLSFSGKNVEVWTADEVGDWLESIGLAEYKAVFADNCIEGETLISMTKADVKELGVEKVGHRVKLDKEIKKLAESNA